LNTWTFLFTDIEGSTPLFSRAPEAYRVALKQHFEILDAATKAHGCASTHNTGDGLLVAFRESRAAVACAVAVQQALRQAAWAPEIGELRVRMGLHRGEAEEEGGELHGLVLHQASRVMTAAHGGQVLCSEVVRDDTVDVPMTDCGLYRLRGVPAPMRLFQVHYEGMPAAGFPPLRTPAAFTHHLPARSTKFFGRDAEIHDLTALLAPEPAGHAPRRYGRLVTLLGPGGTGKTRLSLAVAERLLTAYSGAVWFVELAELRDGALMAESLREGLEIPVEPGAAPLDQVAKTLGSQPSLLVLDNFEQLVPTGVTTVQALLERLPDLVCLISSRIRLELTAEQDFSVAPLFLPPATGTPEELLRNPSVQLYCDRARASRREFQLTTENAPHVAQLCRVLEGMPLALELAAARAAMLTPAQILAKLEHRLDFLVGRKQDFAHRHRTLRAAVAWSYEILTGPIQRLFARLSIFRGGWTLESAEAVACEDPDSAFAALDQLTELQSCSLIVVEERDSAMRYRMLESIREYAGEQLAASGAPTEIAAKHRAFFLALAADRPDLGEAEQLRQLEAEHDNLRAILAGNGPGAERVALAIDLYPFWMQRGYPREGREWLRRLADAAAAAGRSASLANAAGVLAWSCGDLDEARTQFEAALALAEQAGNEAHIAGLLNNLGILANAQGDYPTACARYERGLAIYRQLGWKSELSAALSNHGRNLLDDRQPAAARPVLLEGLRIQRELGEQFNTANTLHNLAEMAVQTGDFPAARRHLAECLLLRTTLGSVYDAAGLFCTLASTALGEARFEFAHRFFLAAQRALEEAGDQPGPVTQQRIAAGLEHSRSHLDPAARERSIAAGREARLREVLREDGSWAIGV